MKFVSNLSALKNLFKELGESSPSERQKGTFFENLVLAFLQNEPFYKEEFPQIWRYADWAR
ncbi:MAG: hypothetical protein LBF22_14010, partial [Deltaproteobacteria bacterium]|nr:hypothetical protein [Deltaproteobacteria bacterium]